MTSNRFSNISDSLLAGFLENSASEADVAELIGSVESSTDLWLLAQMQQSYNAIEDEIANKMIACCDKGSLVRVTDNPTEGADHEMPDRDN